MINLRWFTIKFKILVPELDGLTPAKDVTTSICYATYFIHISF
jgi:hypothetical protein